MMLKDRGILIFEGPLVLMPFSKDVMMTSVYIRDSHSHWGGNVSILIYKLLKSTERGMF